MKHFIYGFNVNTIQEDVYGNVDSEVNLPSPDPWRPQQPSQLFPFRPNRSPRVDNKNQPWYGNRNRSWGKGPGEVSASPTANPGGGSANLVNMQVDPVVANPVTQNPQSSLSGVWEAINSFFNAVLNPNLSMPANPSIGPAVPIPASATLSAVDTSVVMDVSNITNSSGGNYGL